MTLLERVSWCRERATKLLAHRSAPAATRSIPPEYLSLYTYLERRYASIIVLTFEQVEALLGFALPERALIDRDWWTTGAARRAGSHSDAWTAARMTATPNLAAQTVMFERLR
jgi:hypothetical protein